MQKSFSFNSVIEQIFRISYSNSFATLVLISQPIYFLEEEMWRSPEPVMGRITSKNLFFKYNLK